MTQIFRLSRTLYIQKTFRSLQSVTRSNCINQLPPGLCTVNSEIMSEDFPQAVEAALARQAMRQRLGRGNGAASCALAASKA